MVKCNKCGAQWKVDPKKSSSITVCPFCREKIIAQKSGDWKYFDNTKELLEYVSSKYGVDALFSGKYFSDHISPTMARGQRNLLKQAFECGAVKILRDNMNSDLRNKEIAVKQAVAKMIDTYVSAREATEGIIGEIALAIGWSLEKPVVEKARVIPIIDRRLEKQVPEKVREVPRPDPVIKSRPVSPTRVQSYSDRPGEIIDSLIGWGILPLFVYWVFLLDQISLIYGGYSPVRVKEDYHILAFDLLLYLTLLTIFNSPLVKFLREKIIRLHTWILFFISLAVITYGAIRAFADGAPELVWIFVTILAITLLVNVLVICFVWLLYKHYPRLHGGFSLLIALLVIGLTLGGIKIYKDYSFLSEVMAKYGTAEEIRPLLILDSQDKNGVTFHLTGVKEKEIRIKFVNNCWVRAIQDEKLMAEKTFTKGEELILSDAHVTFIRLGYPKGAIVRINDMPLDVDIPDDPFNITVIKD